MTLKLTQENILDIKQSLEIVATLGAPNSKNALISIRKLYPAELLKASYLLLSNEEKLIIKSLTIEINREAGVVV